MPLVKLLTTVVTKSVLLPSHHFWDRSISQMGYNKVCVGDQPMAAINPAETIFSLDSDKLICHLADLVCY